jgi:hypothetical protein
MKIRWVLLCVVAFALFAIPVRAQQNASDGNYLLVSCQISVRSIDNPYVTLTKDEDFRDRFCRGVVLGVGDASSLVCQGRASRWAKRFGLS